MSQKSGFVVKALASVAVLGGVYYVAARRNARRSPQNLAPSARVTEKRAVPKAEAELDPALTAVWEEAAARAAATSDALDVALGLDDIFDEQERERDSGVELTARANEHLPLPRTGDDDDAPSPDDLGSAWLAQATESERSLRADDLLLDVENLEPASGEDESDSGEADDETTREYVRRHRISLLG